MKIGMNMLLWTTDVGEEHFPLLEALAETGFDGVEIPLSDRRDSAYRARLAAQLDRIGLERTAIVVLPPEANAVSADPVVRRAAVERLRWATQAAAELGCEVLAGPIHSAYAQFSGGPPTADESERCAEVMRAAAEEGERSGVTLAVEVLNRFECYMLTTAAQGRDLVRRVDHPRFRLHYDTHHAHIEESDPAEAIRSCKAEIGHVHISENHRGTPGRGQVAWDATFRALREIGYDGWLVIEAFSRSDPAFANMIHVWRDFAPTTEEIYREGFDFVVRSWERADI